MKKKFNSKKGMSLISMIMVAVIIIVVIYIAIIVLKDGIKVLSKANTARKETKDSQITEEVNLIIADYSANQATASGSNKLTFSDFLNGKKEDGSIKNYWDAKNLVVVNYNNNYVLLIPSSNSYSIKGVFSVESDEYAQKMIENYEKAIDTNSKETIEFEDKNTYIISDLVRANSYNYAVKDFESVSMVILGNIEINNKNSDKPAIDLGSNSSLNLYVFDNAKISSLYNGYEKIEYNTVRSEAGYAGIHVPESSSLKIFGSGSLSVYGGPAGKGGTYNKDDLTAGAGGGGAGAGIGGNGGAGGESSELLSGQGGNGEACGTVELNQTIVVNAYGGAGAEGGDSILEGAGAGGGYPAAGIGGGRSRRPEVLQCKLEQEVILVELVYVLKVSQVLKAEKMENWEAI